MINFAPYITYKMDKCYLTQLECVGIIAIQMADWDDDLSCGILDSLHSLDFIYGYDKNLNQTRFDFGNHSAIFMFSNRRNQVRLQIYERNDSKYSLPIFTHIFTEDEMMEFVDYSDYHAPERLEDD